MFCSVVVNKIVRNPVWPWIGLFKLKGLLFYINGKLLFTIPQQSKYKVINKDQWCNVLEFSRTINLDLSNYDEDGACEWTHIYTYMWQQSFMWVLHESDFLHCVLSFYQGQFCWTSLWNGTRRGRCHRCRAKWKMEKIQLWQQRLWESTTNK